MAIQWSEEQLKAIHTTDHNILVSASAGAGKTTVLVARLMTSCRNQIWTRLKRSIAGSS